MILGATLIISGVAFIVGAVCAVVWGPAGEDQISLFWTGSALIVAGLAAPLLDLFPGQHPGRGQGRRGRRRRRTRSSIASVAPRTAGRTVSGRDRPADEEPILLLQMIQLTQAQLAESWAVTRDQNTYALALSGLMIAIIGVVVAAQSAIGDDWWVPVPGLVVTSVFALVATRGVSSKLGPEPLLFYEAERAKPTPEALAQLLVDLVRAQQDVPAVLRVQRRGLLLVAGLFAATATYSVALLV